ncbi:alpha/beta hydrolase [Ferrimonas balearica]|uniref:alpha/beta hydrolase n=1 Tax=Ferrimonas balearica TaxID=44012 RepID=UPI001C994A27|nr:alpha/beta hydrolase [Ferrimonas balearica]MBY5991784.1 alpha/beta hydrolase [Ferrimonas balearica]
MSKTKTAAAPMVTLAIALSASLPAAAGQSHLEIGPRTLPPSAGVSEAFRASQIATPILDPAPMDFVPSTEADWLAYIEKKDAATEVNVRHLAEALEVTITKERIAGVNVHWVTPPEVAPKHQDHLFVYIHGGAYVFNGGMAGLVEPMLIASRLQMPVISIDYRMPPKHPAPAATDDVIAAWSALLESRSPDTMVMGGTSAGANITLAASQRFVQQGLAMPAALYIGTPTVDLNADAGDSRYLNEGADRVLIKMGDFATAAMDLYAGTLGVEHPYVSPIFGDFTSLPPTYLISGTRDLLLSDTVRAHRALRRAGVDAQLHVYEGQGHADYLVAMNTPESNEHFEELNRFVLMHLRQPQAGQLPGVKAK